MQFFRLSLLVGLCGLAVPVFSGVSTAAARPSVRIDSRPDAVTSAASASVVFSSDTAGATFTCALDQAAPEPCSSPVSYSDLTEGQHDVTVVATGPDGTQSFSSTVEWVVDTTPPEAYLWNVVTLRDHVSLYFSPVFKSDDPSVHNRDESARMACRVDDGDWSDCTSPLDLDGVAAGPHRLSVLSTDAAGNSSVTDLLWTQDDWPKAVIDAEPFYQKEQTAEFQFSSPDPDATFECALNDAPWTPCASPMRYGGLPEGSYEFHLRAVSHGHVGPEVLPLRFWGVDRTPPVTRDLRATILGPGQVGINFSFWEGPLTFECRVDSGPWQSCPPFTVTDAPPMFATILPFRGTVFELAPGRHVISVRSTDQFGNVETRPPTVDVDVPAQIPTARLVASSLNKQLDGQTARAVAARRAIKIGAPSATPGRMTVDASLPAGRGRIVRLAHLARTVTKPGRPLVSVVLTANGRRAVRKLRHGARLTVRVQWRPGARGEATSATVRPRLR